MLYNEKGEPVEGALTPEEATTKLTEKEAAIADLQKQIDEVGPKGKSIVDLRKQKEAAEAALEAMKTNVISKLSEFSSLQESKELDRTISSIAEGDAELAKKIKDTYTEYVKDNDSEEVKRKKLGDAYRLNAPTASPDVLQSVLGGGGAPKSGQETTPGNFPESLIAFGAKFGLSRDDFKGRKYTKKQ